MFHSLSLLMHSHLQCPKRVQVSILLDQRKLCRSQLNRCQLYRLQSLRGEINVPTVPQPEAVPHPVILLGPSSNVGLAEPDDVAVITVIVFCAEELEPDTDCDEADTVMVVLEITMTDDTEAKLLDELDKVLAEDDGDELLDEEDELELDEVLLKVGAIEPDEEDDEEEVRLLLLLLEVDESDLEVDDGCVYVLVVKLLTKVVLVTKIPLLKELDALVELARHEDGMEVDEQHGRAKVAVVDSKTPV